MITRNKINQPDEIETAADIIRRGGVVAFPTETVYGLGANALDPTAVARIFEIKHRPRFDPLIVHVERIESARALIADSKWNECAEHLAVAFWPGPLTLVLPKRDRVPDIVTAGLPTIALRVPDHAIAQSLIEQSGVPIAAPSANAFGRVSPTTASHVRESLGDAVDFILDGGPCRAGLESTIVSFTYYYDDAKPVLLRSGATTLEEIERVVGPVQRGDSRASQSAPHAPGMLERHYATQTPLRLIARESDPGALIEKWSRTGEMRIGVICFDDANSIPIPGESQPGMIEVLSPGGDLREAAAHLFAAMRRLDGLGLDLILACEFPNHGLGLAINDRLRRAAHDRRRESSA